MTRAGHSSHRYAFDSLRALSFLGVFLYHLNPLIFPHAYLGVVGFFCLAGYLSLRKLIWQEARGLGRPRLGPSLRQKIAKLYPPLMFLLFVLSLVMILVFPMFLDHYAGQLRSAILGFNNWWQITLGDSYFQGQAYLKPLTHIWALSLEFQFYLVFSLTVERFYRSSERSLWLYQFALFSLGSLAFLWIFTQGVDDPTRAYYGTDTRFFSFSLGSFFALLREPSLARAAMDLPGDRSGFCPPYQASLAPDQARVRGPEAPVLAQGHSAYDRALRFFHTILITLLFLLVIAAYFLPFGLMDMVRYGLPAYSLVYAGLMALLADGDHFLEAVGQFPIIRWICTRSYEIYLWHYPVFVIIERLLTPYPIPTWALAACQAGLALGLAELAYRLVAFLRGTGFTLKKFAGSYASVASLVLALVLLLTPWQQLYVVTGGAEFRKLEADLADAEARLEARKAEAASRKSAELTSEAERESEPSDSPSSSPRPTDNPPTSPATSTKATRAKGPGDWEIKGQLHIPAPQPIADDDWQYDMMRQDMLDFNALEGDFSVDMDLYDQYRDIPISMIGDSVSVINSYYIFPYLPGLDLDALSNRQMWEVWDIYSRLKAAGPLGEIVIIALGSNGDIDTESLTKVWRDLNGKPLILVNIVLPYALTEAERNGAIEDFVDSHDQVYLMDWHANAKTRPDYFQEDYIHPSELGSKAYCQLLTSKVMEIVKLYKDSDLVVKTPKAPQVNLP